MKMLFNVKCWSENFLLLPIFPHHSHHCHNYHSKQSDSDSSNDVASALSASVGDVLGKVTCLVW